MTNEREVAGYRAPQVCKLVGITYRQLDYWARTNLIVPSMQQAHGSGSQRVYSFTDVVQLKVIKNLLDAGMSLKKIRSAVEILRNEMDSEQPLADVTLLSDGQTIYAAHSDEEVVDVLRKGQGVFSIAIGPVQDQVEGAIHQLFPDHEEDLAGVVELGAT
ncbi:MAG TPA: MerR family transcriptional regulator [Acidimicrobiia bacterium]|nr:MerR family transcriptional regulator [Acidimicrobiia bacterium]